MAKVKIQGNASGTGVLTVTAPNTSTDRTITLPDSTGTLLTADGDGSSLTGVGVAGISSSADATAITIDSNERVGIGIGSPLSDLHIHNSADHTRLNIDCSNSSGDNWQFQSRNNGEFWLRNDDHSRNDIVVYPSNGAVTMPNQPSIVLGGDNGGYVTVNSGSVAPFNNIETQTGGSNYNTSTYRYTAPVAGWYQVTFHALSQSEIEQEWLLRKNANTIRRTFQPTDSVRSWSFSTQVYCAVNDYLDIESNTSNSNNIYMSSGGNMYSWVSYRLLG